MLDSRFETLPLFTDIYATLNPGGYTARVDSISQTGMTLRYITIQEAPPKIQGIILLVDGYVEALMKDDFMVIRDQELKNSRSNGYRLRKIEVSFLEDTQNSTKIVDNSLIDTHHSPCKEGKIKTTFGFF